MGEENKQPFADMETNQQMTVGKINLAPYPAKNFANGCRSKLMSIVIERITKMKKIWKEYRTTILVSAATSVLSTLLCLLLQMTR